MRDAVSHVSRRVLSRADTVRVCGGVCFCLPRLRCSNQLHEELRGIPGIRGGREGGVGVQGSKSVAGQESYDARIGMNGAMAC